MSQAAQLRCNFGVIQSHVVKSSSDRIDRVKSFDPFAAAVSTKKAAGVG